VGEKYLGEKSVGEKSFGENRGRWDAGFRFPPSQVYLFKCVWLANTLRYDAFVVKLKKNSAGGVRMPWHGNA
jgi:hypothetical protein